MFTSWLTFSDAAKYALIAKNLVLSNGFVTDFSFWGSSFFPTGGIPRLLPYIISVFLKIFGIGDFGVLAFSFFFFLLLVLSVFFLGKKLYGNLVGLLSAVVVIANLDFINYATSGASEVLFTFEIVLATYFLIIQKKWGTVASFLLMIMMYFSRPQAFIYIGGLVFLWTLLKFGFKKGLVYFLSFGVFAYFFDRLVIYPLSFRLPLTSVFGRGFQTIITYSSKNAVSDSLRGGAVAALTGAGVLKKVFYNLYNFYKALPAIANPYMWGLFIISLFSWDKDGTKNSYKTYTLFAVAITFLVAALSIPFYRYLHPVVPLVYVVSVATLVEYLKRFFNEKKLPFISFVAIYILVIGQTLGALFLDSRFEKKLVNKNKPPVYVLLSYKLKENTSTDDVIITNLDTWGSWYGERKTIWFPLKPEQLVSNENKEIPFNAIYLTNYLIDDENYYMGDEWRQIFYNPEDPENEYIAENYELKEIFEINADDVYEKQNARAVLLTRKTQ